MRRFERLKADRSSRDFVQIRRRGRVVTRESGVLGGDSKRERKELANGAAARKTMERSAKAKLRAGFFELGVDSGWAPNTPTPSLDTQRDSLRELLCESSLEQFDGLIQKLARPAICVDWMRTWNLDVGVSKVGGYPDLPRGVDWPVYRDGDDACALDFVAQIRLSDLKGLPDVGLPKTGLLSFFVLAHWKDAWEPKYLSVSQVIYTSSRKKITSRQPPDSYPRKLSPGECAVRFFPTLSLPQATKIDNKRKLSSKEAKGLARFLSRRDLATYGIGRRDWQLGGYRNPYDEVKDPMLLQCDSDHPEMVWGDRKWLTFFVSKRNLKARRFDRAWSCYE